MSKKFEVIDYSRDDDSYMYSDTDYYWHVRSLQSGDELADYSGSDCENSAGRTRSGIRTVTLDEENLTVTAVPYEGDPKVLELPEKITFVDGGAKIALHYRDGRVDERERRRVCMTSKYGEPTFLPLKRDPDKKK